MMFRYVVCPDCSAKNLPGRMHCLGCARNLADLQPSEEAQRLLEGQRPIEATSVAEVIHSGYTADLQSLGERVHSWYRAYCAASAGILVLVLVCLLAAGSRAQEVVSMMQPPLVLDYGAQQQQAVWLNLIPGFFLIVVMLAIYVAAIVMKPTSKTWGFGILVLCLGLSGCSLPFAVILLIHWFKPEVQEYFRGGVSA